MLSPPLRLAQSEVIRQENDQSAAMERPLIRRRLGIDQARGCVRFDTSCVAHNTRASVMSYFAERRVRRRRAVR